MTRFVKLIAFLFVFTSGCAKSATDEEKIVSELKNALTAWTLNEDKYDYSARVGKKCEVKLGLEPDWMDGIALLDFEIKGIREVGELNYPHPLKVPGSKTYKVAAVLTLQSGLPIELKKQRIYVAELLQANEEGLKPYWIIHHSILEEKDKSR
jgi:hypothetical protein